MIPFRKLPWVIVCLSLALGNVSLAQSGIPQNGLIADVPFTEQTGTVANDVTGNGNACTFAAAPNTPTWNGIGIQEINNPSRQWCTFPSTLAPAVRTVAVCAYLPAQVEMSHLNGNYSGGDGNLGYPTLLGAQDRSGLTLWLATGTPQRLYYQQSDYSGIYQPTGTNDMSIGWNCFFYALGSGSDSPKTVDHFYKNGTEVSSYIEQTASASLLPATGEWYLGAGWPTDPVTNSLAFVGTFEHVLAWDRILSPTEISDAWSALQTEMIGRGVVFDPPTSDTADAVAACLGDSQTSGGVGGATSWCTTQLMPLPPVGDSWQLINNGIQGTTCVAMESGVPAEEALNWSPKAPHTAMMLYCGINDITVGEQSAAQIWARQLAICKLARTAGYENITSTTLPSWLNEDTAVEQLNTLIRANWSACFNSVVDVANDPRLGAAGAYSNSTYFDQSQPSHLTTAGQTILGGYASNILASLYGNTAAAPTVVTGSSYTETAADNYVAVNATSSATTITLPSCLGYVVGHTRTVSDVSAGQVSIVAQQNQEINGSENPFVIGQGEKAVFTVQIVSPVTAGCTWTTPAPDLTLSSVNHNMGSVAIGTSTTYGVQVTNHDATAFPFSMTLTPNNGATDFSFATNCGTSLAAGKSCEIVFTYTPESGASGIQTATWSIAGQGRLFAPSNGGTLTGTAVNSGSLTLTTSAHNFGDQTVGTTSSVYGTVLTNSYSFSITLAFLTTGNTADFTTTANNCGASLPANASCNLQFTFNPKVTGFLTESMSIAASYNGNSVTIVSLGSPVSGISLKGTGD